MMYTYVYVQYIVHVQRSVLYTVKVVKISILFMESSDTLKPPSNLYICTYIAKCYNGVYNEISDALKALICTGRGSRV